MLVNSEPSNLKHSRVLTIYTKLIQGEIVNKSQLSEHFGVDNRTIQRDIEQLQRFFELDMCERDNIKKIIYDRKAKGYRLDSPGMTSLSNSEILAVSKVLLESRAFIKDEIMPILDKLLKCCVPEKHLKHMENLISNEKHHYVEPCHKVRFADTLWELSFAVREHKRIEVEYCRLKEKSTVKRVIEPVGIIFSEYYFYLAAYISDKNTDYPTIYRIDRIKDFKILDEHFHVPYSDRFEEGEFRKRVQFMYSGEVQRIEFKYTGESPEAVMDRLPTATIIEEKDGVVTFNAEVFGKGIKMWLLSQMQYIEVTKPVAFRDEIRETLSEMLGKYDVKN